MAERRAIPDRRGRGKDRAAEPKPFVFAHTSRGWRVKQGKQWRHATEIFVSAPFVTRPNGELHGVGVVERDGDVIRITA